MKDIDRLISHNWQQTYSIIFYLTFSLGFIFNKLIWILSAMSIIMSLIWWKELN